MNLSSPMLDGCKSGVNLSGVSSGGLSTQITSDDYEYLKKVFIENFQVVRNRESYIIKVSLEHTFATLKLNHFKGRYYFNVDGNPISFTTGQNILGSTDIAGSIVDYYKAISRAIKQTAPSFAMPVSIRQNVEQLNIYLHGLTFAYYSQELNLKGIEAFRRMLDGIEHLYSSAPVKGLGTLKEGVGINVHRDGPTTLRLDKKYSDTNGKYWTLSMYHKWSELKARGKRPPDFVRDRIRFDLTLHNRWFLNNKMKTLADLTEAQSSNFEGWLNGILRDILEKTGLEYWSSFTPIHLLDIGKWGNFYDKWERGEKVAVPPLCFEWFASQGVNVRLPYDLHCVATMARCTFNLDEGEVKRVVKHGTVGLLGKQMEDRLGIVTRRSALIQPSLKFPVVYSPNDQVYYNRKTGQIVEL